MRVAYVLLRCIGKAVVKNVVNLVSFGVGGDILVDAWEYWQEASKEAERPAQVAAVAQLSPAELREEVARIVQEEAARLSPEQQTQVAAYLEQVPATIRRSLRGSQDPIGGAAAAGSAFRKPEDLRQLLPAGLPRFKVGDRPLPGVDWELEELLGVGGFGEVWKARNPHFAGVAPVALKFFVDPSAKQRLLNHEAKLINQVMQQGKHEGIVPLLHTYLGADPPCLAYEYIDGGDLAGLIQARSGGLPSHLAVQIMQKLTLIVGFAHRLNPPIVHRDLKPANILVKQRPGGKLALRITDFGIGGLALLSEVEQSRKPSERSRPLMTVLRGSYTPLYASPQQMQGGDPDPRDDVYALGVIWYQMLTGDLTRGWDGREGWEKLLASRGMTLALLALLASCFEDRREDRPDNAVDLGEKLGRALAQPAQASDPSPFPMAIPLLDALPTETRKHALASWPEPRRAPEEERAPAVVQRETRPEPSGNGSPWPRRGILLLQELRQAVHHLLNGSPWPRQGGLLLGGVLALAVLLLGSWFALKWFAGNTPVNSPVQGLPWFAGNTPVNSPVQGLPMKLKQIPAGTFTMGSTEYDDEKSPHTVEITQPFSLGVYPVTKGQFAAFVKDAVYQTEAERAGDSSTWKNLRFNQTDDDPVVEVTWNDAVKFCEWLSKKEGKAYELPTEAEWEYACRAGTTTAYSFGDDPKALDDYAWYSDNSGSHTHPVGSKKANPWGLYDMHGNVWQWCADGKREYPKAPLKESIKDPKGDVREDGRVLRGGSWDYGPRYSRSAYRYLYAPGDRRYYLGFRVVLRSAPRTP